MMSRVDKMASLKFNLFYPSVSAVVLIFVFMTTDAVEWRSYRNKCLVGSPQDIVFVGTYRLCQEYCYNVTNYLCSSVEYNEVLGECRRRLGTSINRKMIDNCEGWDLYEIREIDLWTGIYDACLNGEVDRIVSNAYAVEVCKEACERETNFRCLSFTYDTVSQQCNLARETRQTRHLRNPCDVANQEYHERVNSPLLKVIYSNFFGGTAQKIINNLFPRDCIEACIAETGFQCVAANYNWVTKQCQLRSSTGALTLEGQWNHFRLEPRLRWRRIYDACLPVPEFNTLQGMTASGCMEACETSEAVACSSVNYNSTNGECQLLTPWSGNAGLSVPCLYGDLDYFELYRNC